MFLAPCTFPLIPAYVSFIGGTTAHDLRDPAKVRGARRRVFINGLSYVIGFSFAFIALGTLFSAGGIALAPYRLWLGRIGGLFIIFFGLYLLGLFRLPFLSRAMDAEHHLRIGKSLTPGKPMSSFVFGVTFALGWTPCVGPVLASILVLASTATTVWQGMFLLTVFSAGLAVPFLLVAWGIGSAPKYVARVAKYLPAVTVIGGLLLVVLGVLLVTDRFSLWVGGFYRYFNFIPYERLLDYL